MDALVFSMSGNPRGKGRPRATVRGAHASIYTDSKTRQYEASIKKLAADAMGDHPPFTGALSVSLRFRMAIPKSAPKYLKAAMVAGEKPHVSTPDLDNCVKAVLDGMNGAVFRDDSQIVRTFASKIYSEKPGVDVKVTPLETQEVDS